MSKAGKLFKWLALAAVLIVAVLAVLLALPVPSWRTGRLPAPPLPVVEKGPQIELSSRIWIDTDAACGLSRRTDPDDCLALMLLAGADGIRIGGISTVFGNADLDETDAVAQALVDRLEKDGRQMPSVLRGAAKPGQIATPARDGLRLALAEGPLTILALGPLTNVVAALKNRPDLQDNVARIVAVMGRRSGHLFHPSEGVGDGILFGHGPIFRDLNFDKDPTAATELLSMELPISLIPYDVARGISLSVADVDRISRAGRAGSWTGPALRDWLGFWNEAIGHDGFHPFDLMAAAYVMDPHWFDCASVGAWIDHDERLSNFWFLDPIALQVGLAQERSTEPRAQSRVIYCVSVGAGLHTRLMEQLAGDRTNGK